MIQANQLSFIPYHGYIILVIAMILEGPITTTLAGFGASLGLFDIFIVYLLSLLGDIIGDSFLFYTGRAGRIVFLKKYPYLFRIRESRVTDIMEHIDNNFRKTILAIKLTPMLAVPGMAIMGTSKVPYRKYIFYCIAISIPKSLVFLSIGYYFGAVFHTFWKYLGWGQWAIGIAIILVIIIPIIFKRILEAFGRRIDKI